MIVNFFKVTSLPFDLEPNSLYFVQSGDNAESYVTSEDGTAKRIGNSVMIRATPLTGLPAGTNTSIGATDTIPQAFAKLQAQINARESTIAAGTTAQYWRGDKSWRNLALDAVTQLTGTANQINVSAAVGSVTLSLPQNIHSGASPTFAGLTLSANLNLATASIINKNGFRYLHASGDESNVFLGKNSGNTTLTGTLNIGIGQNAGLALTTGFQNTFIGNNAGTATTTGASIVAIGASAAADNTTGLNLTAVGVGAARGNTTASYNSVFGINALRWNQTGSENSVFGAEAAFSSSGHNIVRNSIFGASAGAALQTGGDHNCFFGYQAGDNVTAGARNIIIGSQLDAPLPAGSNQIVIGNIIFATGASGTGTTIAGNVGIGTNDPKTRFHSVGSTILGAAAAAAADADLGNSQINPWLNESSNILTFKAKYSSGTVSSFVVGRQQTGWTAATGTHNRAAFASDTATLQDVARRLYSLETDVRAFGIIN